MEKIIQASFWHYLNLRLIQVTKFSPTISARLQIEYTWKYTSPTIQNELIIILGEQIRESIMNQIPSDVPYISILADEVTDVSNRDIG